MEPKAKEYRSAQPDIPRRAEKRLARGLEDVLHLFLTPSSGESTEKEKGLNKPSEPILPTAAPSNPHILVQASSAIDRGLLVTLLKDNAAVLDDGMRTIDANVPCAPLGSMDLLTADRVGRICVINVETFQNDLSILRGIAHVDWIMHNMPIVRRLYEKQAIDFSIPPHLFLVAPSFSPLLKCVAQCIVFPKIHCFGYRAAEIKETVGIIFERA